MGLQWGKPECRIRIRYSFYIYQVESLKSIPCASVIIDNMQGQVLLLLRDDKPNLNFPNHWTLVGGKVEEGETPEMAAYRELNEETGLDKVGLSFLRRYDRHHPSFIVDQYIYTGKVDATRESLVLGEGQDLRFFAPHDIKDLKIGYDFDKLLYEYFMTHQR
jgi:8-oxo-dGTP diphosphatase